MRPIIDDSLLANEALYEITDKAHAEFNIKFEIDPTFYSKIASKLYIKLIEHSNLYLIEGESIYNSLSDEECSEAQESRIAITEALRVYGKATQTEELMGMFDCSSVKGYIFSKFVETNITFIRMVNDVFINYEYTDAIEETINDNSSKGYDLLVYEFYTSERDHRNKLVSEAMLEIIEQLLWWAHNQNRTFTFKFNTKRLAILMQIMEGYTDLFSDIEDISMSIYTIESLERDILSSGKSLTETINDAIAL